MVFERLLYMGVPAAAAWNALIDPQNILQYHLAPMKSTDLRAGGSIIYGTPAGDMIRCEILELEIGRRLVHSFAFVVDSHAGTEADPPTQVSYEIAPMAEMCSLRLIHDGFTETNQTFHNISGGWDMILSSLKTLLETGKPLPWPTNT